MKHTPESLAHRVIRSAADWSSAGQTLTSFLASRFTYRSAPEWRQRIASGEITVNGKAADPEYRLVMHDIIEYRPGDLPEPEANCDYKIVYEDDALLVIDKPANLCVHPSGPFFRHTLWHLLSSRYGEIHLVNRLDRETSGLMLAAKDPQTAAKLARPGYPIGKEYLALVFGTFDHPVDAAGFLVPDRLSAVRKKRKFVRGDSPEAGNGESCRTLLVPEKSGRRFSLVRAVLETGRMHQIRATLFSLGFPLVGDKLYGPDETIFLKLRDNLVSDADREKLILDRQALHSARLAFRHPVDGRELEFSTEPDFRSFPLD